MRLTTHLNSENHDDAVRLLQGYFDPNPTGHVRFEGGQWDTFDPSGTRAGSANTITSDDVLSLTLLSATAPAETVLQLLEDEELGQRISRLLEAIGPDRDLHTSVSMDEDSIPAGWALYRELRKVKGLGPTKVSKLMARKRPRLFPVYDDFIGEAFLGGSNLGHWEDLHAAMQPGGLIPGSDLGKLHGDAGLSEEVSLLRVIDVLAWLDATRKGEDILRARR